MSESAPSFEEPAAVWSFDVSELSGQENIAIFGCIAGRTIGFYPPEETALYFFREADTLGAPTPISSEGDYTWVRAEWDEGMFADNLPDRAAPVTLAEVLRTVPEELHPGIQAMLRSQLVRLKTVATTKQAAERFVDHLNEYRSLFPHDTENINTFFQAVESRGEPSCIPLVSLRELGLSEKEIAQITQDNS